MRLKLIILEADYNSLSKKHGVDVDKVEEYAALDPSSSKKYLPWIITQIKAGQIIVPEDNEKISNNLSKLMRLKENPAFKEGEGPQGSNINTYKDPPQLAKVLEKYSEVSGREAKRKGRAGGFTLPPGAELIYDQGNVKIVKITSPQASSLLCSGTEWCTANVKTAEKYLSRGPLYLIYEDDKRAWLLFIKLSVEETDENEGTQFKDVYDKEGPVKLKYKYIDIVLQTMGSSIVDQPMMAVQYAYQVMRGRWPEAEPKILADAKAAARYAVYVIKGRWPEAEPIIMRDPSAALDYTMEVINGLFYDDEYDEKYDDASEYGVIYERWPEAEPFIMQDAKVAASYADKVIEGRWPEAEPIIMTDAASAYYYVSRILGDRWPEAEPYIIKDPKFASKYARDVIMDRWPEAEPIIMKDPKSAYQYAASIIEGRWLEAEPIIIKHPRWAYAYARDVIKGRWPEAEPFILSNPYSADLYTRDVINGQWPKVNL